MEACAIWGHDNGIQTNCCTGERRIHSFIAPMHQIDRLHRPRLGRSPLGIQQPHGG